MSETRLKAFYAVAKNLSFTKAAEEMYISQPAITRHVSRLEDEYQVHLFNRCGNKIELTAAGRLMLEHCERILSDYNNLRYDMHLLNKEHVGQLRIGASTTISQYVLPPILASFIDNFPKTDISLVNGNSRLIESELSSNNIDVGLIEGATRLPTLTYTPLYEDELLVISNPRSVYAKDGFLDITNLRKAPFIMREQGSGTLEIIEKCLARYQIKMSSLNIRMYLGSTEAIKLFIQNSDALCILSRIAVQRELEEGTLSEIQIPGISFKRTFCFVQSPGPQLPLVNRFIDFVQKAVELDAINNKSNA